MTQRSDTLKSEPAVPAPSHKARLTSLTFWVGLILFLGFLALILVVILIVIMFQKPSEPKQQIRVDWTRQPFILT